MDGSLHYWVAKHAKKVDDDYHGNFNTELFEHRFEQLCMSLTMSIGPSIIHMDGAKYHKRVLNPQPTAKWLKLDIQNWLM